MKAPHARERFIREWLFDNPGAVDILNAEFVAAFIKFSECRFRPTNWGAFKCLTLNTDLARMYRDYSLERSRTGLSGNWQPGFPRWVWSYRLTQAWREHIAAERAV